MIYVITHLELNSSISRVPTVGPEMAEEVCACVCRCRTKIENDPVISLLNNVYICRPNK